MGLLDSNFTKIQGREKSGVLFSQLSGTWEYNKHRIDCRGYNSLLLGLTAYTNDVDVEIVGIYPDGVRTYNTIDVPILDLNGRIKEKIELTSVPVLGVRRYLVDVSKFDYIGVAKTVDNDNTLSCTFQLTQKQTDIELFDYENYFKQYTGTAVLSSQLTYTLPTKKGKNAVLYRITVDEDTAPIIAYAVTKKGKVNASKTIYSINDEKFITDNYPLSIGVHYFVIPIKTEYESIYFRGGGSVNKTIEIKDINFDFEKVKSNPRIYWASQTGLIGKNNAYKIPDGVKMVQIVITGNTDSVGGLLMPHYIEKNTDVIPDTTKLKTFEGIKIFNKTTGETITSGEIVITSGVQNIVVDSTNLGWISLQGYTLPIEDVKVEFVYDDEMPIAISKKIQSPEDYTSPVSIEAGIEIIPEKIYKNPDLQKVFENEKVYVYKNTNERILSGVFRNIAVWNSETEIALSLGGLDGEQEIISLNSVNFPGLISGATIERVILLPFSRNATNAFGGYDWRMNVIMNNGQVYHNYPARLTYADGQASPNDYKLFDESCIWELPERWTPVKTNIGIDADLIASGKYKYFPCLPDECYEFHPAINQDNGYNNGGFPAVLEKTNQDGQTVKFSRFYFPNRSGGYQSNPLGFMGGFEPHPKLSVIGTYKSNSSTTGSTRICVFLTNDGGRNWFARYEYGANAILIDSEDNEILSTGSAMMKRLMKTDSMTASAGASLFNVRSRKQYIPSELNKEIDKIKKFKYGTSVPVSSITATTTDIVVETTVPHGVGYQYIVFEKQLGAASSEWDWIVSEGHDELSAGNGVLFRAETISETSFRLKECVYNPHNNLTCRHIHSINRCQHGYAIGSGEIYPNGWIQWLEVQQADAFGRLYPWDDLKFIRLTSTDKSLQRPLGVIIKNDPSNTVYFGSDTSVTELNDAVLPEGRTDTFKKSSQGVWKGKLTDIDNQTLYECIFESQEVAYFFKEINGVMIYIGQQGHVGISTDEGNTWIQCHLNTGDVSRFGGISYNGEIVISNFIFKVK